MYNTEFHHCCVYKDIAITTLAITHHKFAFDSSCMIKQQKGHDA